MGPSSPFFSFLSGQSSLERQTFHSSSENRPFLQVASREATSHLKTRENSACAPDRPALPPAQPSGRQALLRLRRLGAELLGRRQVPRAPSSGKLTPAVSLPSLRYAAIGKLYRARSRLYRSGFLQVNARLKTLGEIRKIYCTAPNSEKFS